jgi:hypothetical protein
MILVARFSTGGRGFWIRVGGACRVCVGGARRERGLDKASARVARPEPEKSEKIDSSALGNPLSYRESPPRCSTARFGQLNTLRVSRRLMVIGSGLRKLMHDEICDGTVRHGQTILYRCDLILKCMR